MDSLKDSVESWQKILPELVMPPINSEDVCSFCRSWKSPAHSHCWNCKAAVRVLGECVPVLPVSLYKKPSVFRDWVTYYKPGREIFEPSFGGQLSVILQNFVRSFLERVQAQYGAVDFFVPVPSTGQGGEAFNQVASDSDLGLACHSDFLSVTPGYVSSHAAPSREMMLCSNKIQGRRVIILDDVYTTGARAQSASHAVRSAGGEVACVITIGRRINPDFSPHAWDVWQRQSQYSYSLSMTECWLS